MMLSDLGAEVVRVDRPSAVAADGSSAAVEILGRGRRSVAIDLKHPEGRATVLRMVERADALMEGFRPGVVERLGIGPDDCLARNRRLVYGRMTGWGQSGEMAQAAGHDINYIALSGALFSIGRAGQAPVPPLNLVGDFGGGATFLAFGLVCAILHARATGEGQVVDTAMVDGAALLTTFVHEMTASGAWVEERGANALDSGAPYYDAYETADGQYVAIGALEGEFYRVLMDALGTTIPRGRERWPEARARFAEIFATKTRDEWCALLAGTDACFAPVLAPSEARAHPHNVARRTFVEVGEVAQPGPTPRFSATPTAVPTPAVPPGANTEEVLGTWGFDPDEVAALRQSGAVAQA
jgi:alpha-methylacyl-CoA racemase